MERLMTVRLLRTERNGTEWNKNRMIENKGTRMYTIKLDIPGIFNPGYI